MQLIGLEPGDRYEGYGAILHFYKTAGASGVDVTVNEIDYSVGTIGLVLDLVSAKLPDGNAIPVRHTYVFHREQEAWNVVHSHISVGNLYKDLVRIFNA